MKYIVFIIVLFFMSFKTFAWKYDQNCTDFSINDIKFTQKNRVTVTVHGPQKKVGGDICCLQQGVMMIGNYFINPWVETSSTISVPIWKDREWVNGYSENNIVNPQNCENLNCNTIYEGEVDYTRADNFGSSSYIHPGTLVTLSMDVYGHCIYESGETMCYQGCTISHLANYDPPNE
ncbi:hypothetical protein C1646_803503 [Rhizophagus diaphanus]|nr:hypothetical protein C1646_803503 [Rhizophagus diaphanus] [Rhizophagus sp. MUCL 43196]